MRTANRQIGVYASVNHDRRPRRFGHRAQAVLKQYAALLGYNGSKATLNAVTLMYARELADNGFRVNTLSQVSWPPI